jgi:hypothetical protein
MNYVYWELLGAPIAEVHYFAREVNYGITSQIHVAHIFSTFFVILRRVSFDEGTQSE